MAEYFDPNQNQQVHKRQSSGLNLSSFLRPRRARRRTTVQRSTQLPTPPRQEITPPRVEKTNPYVKGGGKETSLESDRPAMISSPAPSVSDTVSNPIEKNFTDGAPSDVAIPLDPNNPHLRYIRNPYPSIIGENPASNYSRSNGSIKLKGKYKENSLTFTEYPLTGITQTGTPEDPHSYNFIIQFMDTTRYISDVFFAELELEFNVGNPYRTLNSVATVKVDDALLSQYASLKKFDIGEKYAEMDITNNINTKKEIISYINWLVGSGAELRDVASMGSFTHNQTDDLGFTFQPAIDGEELDPNAAGSESNIGVDIGESIDPVVESDPIVVNDVFPPFGVAGIRPNELRTKDGKKYRWDRGRRGIFGRRGADTGTWICIGDTAPTQSTPAPKPPQYNPPNPGGGYGGLGNLPGPITLYGGGSFGGGGRGSGNNGFRNRFL